ncbi:hypothetical protein [Maribacter antarcticus]|uniref:hypothetical protein n=1 Tax=Maribacter antarcticus TaxID=505250 RepID=UPI00047B3DF0|nr:hypothetical protein [Maribacter antarcticus]
MNSPIFLDSESVMKYTQSRGLYNALVAQVNRDFTRVNLKLAFGLNPQPKELQTVIREKIYLLLMERFSEYLNVMYAVDIPERAFKNLEIKDTVDVAEQVTFLILKRELQKLELKEKYKSKD